MRIGETRTLGGQSGQGDAKPDKVLREALGVADAELASLHDEGVI